MAHLILFCVLGRIVLHKCFNHKGHEVHEGKPRTKMIIGKVVGTVVTTISHPHYKDRRLLVVQPMLVEGEAADEDFIALDNSQAGIGDTVLVNREGNGARQALKNPDAAVISVIVGIVDSVYLENEVS